MAALSHMICHTTPPTGVMKPKLFWGYLWVLLLHCLGATTRTSRGHRDACEKTRVKSTPCKRTLTTVNWKDGAPTRTRTADLLITNQLLYQLSYRGLGQRDSASRGRAQDEKFVSRLRISWRYLSAYFPVIDPAPFAVGQPDLSGLNSSSLRDHPRVGSCSHFGWSV